MLGPSSLGGKSDSSLGQAEDSLQSSISSQSPAPSTFSNDQMFAGPRPDFSG